MTEEVNISGDSPWADPYKLGTRCERCLDYHKQPGSTQDCYRAHLAEKLEGDPDFLEPLRGKTLACDKCPPDSRTCHARVIEYLLERPGGQKDDAPLAIAKCADLKSLAKSIRAGLGPESDIILDFKPGDGIYVRFVNAGDIYGAELTIPAEVSGERSEGCNVGRFVSISASLPKSGDARIDCIDDKGLPVMRFVASGAAAKMALVDARYIQTPALPDFPSQDVTVSGLDPKWLLGAVRSCEKHSDRLHLVASNGKFYLESLSDARNLSSIALEADSAIVEGEAKTLFALDVLKEICTALPSEVTIRFATDYPATFTTDTTRHLLSPIVEKN